ncbi:MULTISPECIES: acylneuraminate cytidylyltransferase family protein [Providencia]|uniref:Spore coat polysaccharide biosynthesis protein, predicted glycosyltransferase n=1 Tax=Providencia rettgeri TaxID=587 RepID=A0A379FXL4_PRORE|nr:MULTISPECIES: acylneuraminate cytidylyltransferase family protein [Providencia]QXB06051.1 hypothetical protein I6L80_01890 [Providencia rettgeri]SUC33594.1 Spore coat polysaccharide biosynthesis protein, predicted glycosyltransferase [Providencia rettgeri]
MITAFLPCRKGSQRIKDKNVKIFAGVSGGLLEIKLKQLLACKEIDKIIVSSNDDRVLSFSNKINHSKIIIDERPEHLGNSQTTTDELIKYVPTIIKEGSILWTHVTSPFVTSEIYTNLINTYKEKFLEGYDSLLTAKKIQSFLWNSNEPINYDRNIEKWPRTQTIEPIYEVDSAAFIASLDIYKKHNDRIGLKPFIYAQGALDSIDIDWPEDFTIAEKIFEYKTNKHKES